MSYLDPAGQAGPSEAIQHHVSLPNREARSLTNTQIVDVLRRVDSPPGSRSASAGPAPREGALLPDSPGFSPLDLTTDNPAVQERRRAQRLRQSTCWASRRPDASGKTRGGSREEASTRATRSSFPARITWRSAVPVGFLGAWPLRASQSPVPGAARRSLRRGGPCPGHDSTRSASAWCSGAASRPRRSPRYVDLRTGGIRPAPG